MNNVTNGFNCFQNGGGWMMGGMILFWITLIVGLFLLFKSIQNNKVSTVSVGNSRENHSLQILNERLAKGEISVEEYEKLKNTLMK